jgi:hypothetical protein
MGQVRTHNLRSMLCLVLEATDSMYRREAAKSE